MIYTKHIGGRAVYFTNDGPADEQFLNIPGNSDYDRMMAEVADGTSTIVEQDDTPVPTWEEKRTAPIDAGGYGTIPEQMEIIGEQGIAAFQAHIAAVKAAIPKTD